MDFHIQNKTALVCGGGGGLGQAIARSLAAEGVKVVLADINVDEARNCADAIREQGGTALALKWDIADLESARDNLNQARAHVGEIDILINNTGGPPPTSAAGVPPAEWERYFRLMVSGVIHLTDLVLPGMRERKWGRIITSTSSGIVAPIPNLGISNSLRLALVGWSKTLAREIAADGVTANIILPGRIATARIEQLDRTRAQREGLTLEEVIKLSVDSIPAGRYGTPKEYGDTVAFLASESASYITGSVIRVDGGYIPSI